MNHFLHSDTGAVAAGHIETARVGARVLEQGGNAVDAACAMMFASTVVESTLTTLGGGGFMLVAGPGLRPTMLDFFVRQPGFGPRRTLAPWQSFKLELDDKVLHFGTGPASVAVPGMAKGIAFAAEHFGSLPLPAIALPAIELASDGMVLSNTQEVEHHLNRELLSSTPEGAAIYVRADGTTHREGEVMRQPALARALEQVAATQASCMYEGDMADALVRWSDERGGRISAEDLAGYEVRVVEPIATRVGDVEVFTNPRPAMGGVLILRMLEAILAGDTEFSSARVRDEHVARALTRVLGELKPPLTRPPVDGDLVDPDHMSATADEALGRMTPDDGGRFAGSPNTTHISVIDRDGMVATTTTTVGYGSGEFVPGTGIQLNNVLAEYDHTARRPPGSTVPSMMSPTLLQGPRTTVAIGSAGSDRIPQAIAQILARMWHGEALGEAILAPRFVFDGVHLHCEPGADEHALEALAADLHITRWTSTNAYFGTSNAVCIRDGRLYSQGDTRREGAGIVLPQ